MARNPKVDKSFNHATRWRREADLLRAILLECGLSEELKWGKPCYAYDGRNIKVALFAR